MKRNHIFQIMATLLLVISFTSCVPEINKVSESVVAPESFNGGNDTTSTANISWRSYFNDPFLIALIDTAMINNQELNIVKQEIDIAKNEVSARKGEYLPFVDIGLEGGLDKVGKYTRSGAVESNLDIRPSEEFPEPYSDLQLGAFASWEVDIWKKLRNAKQAAYNRYLASVEGRNFLVTQLIAEVAGTYYELIALDNQLDIIRQNIDIQSSALEIVKLQKQSAKVTELAVKRFEAQLLDTRSMQYYTQQQITETENKLNFLLGRFPQKIARSSDSFLALNPGMIASGIPAQLLANRPDIREAEFNLQATKLDLASSRANFYPSLDLHAGMGFQAFKPGLLFTTPESMMYAAAGGLVAPLVNRKGIIAYYKNANAKQVQALYEYEQSIINAYVEVVNQLTKIENVSASLALKTQQVDALIASVEISNNLFRSARADYMEVLLTQEEALESRFELIETKMDQLHAWINIYRSLGGGWK